MTEAKKPAAKKAPAKRAPRKRKPAAKKPAPLAEALDKAEAEPKVAPAEPLVYEMTEGVMFYGPHGTVWLPAGKRIERAGYRKTWPLLLSAIDGKAKPVG